MKLNLNTKGFTLIEILLVVGIISLLSSAFFFGVTDARKKGEDSHMKSEALEVQKAVELYRLDNNGNVPHPGLTVKMVREGSDEYATAMSKLVPKYLPEVPRSPSGNSYAYMVSDDAMSAVFAANLNFEDRESNRNSCDLVDDSGIAVISKKGLYSTIRTDSRNTPTPVDMSNNCPVVPLPCSVSDSLSLQINSAIQQYSNINGFPPYKVGISDATVLNESDSNYSDNLQPLVDSGYISSIPRSDTGEGYVYYFCFDDTTNLPTNGAFLIDRTTQYCTDLISGDAESSDGSEDGSNGPVCDGNTYSDFCICIE